MRRITLLPLVVFVMCRAGRKGMEWRLGVLRRDHGKKLIVLRFLYNVPLSQRRQETVRAAIHYE